MNLVTAVIVEQAIQNGKDFDTLRLQGICDELKRLLLKRDRKNARRRSRPNPRNPLPHSAIAGGRRTVEDTISEFSQ